METPGREAETSFGERPQENVITPAREVKEIPEAREKEQNEPSATNVQKKEPSAAKPEEALDPNMEFAKLESEFGTVNTDNSAEEVGDWEFDELERELRIDDSATRK